MLHDVRRQITRLGLSNDALRGAHVSVRTKGLFSTFHKACIREQQVHDVLAVRVVLRKSLEGDEAVFAAHEAIRGAWSSSEGRYKDYVARPKPNGYRAIHDTMSMQSGHAFELQIRSRSMHLSAEWGMAAHRKYKGALWRLPMAVMSGVASSSVASLQQRIPWPAAPTPGAAGEPVLAPVW